MGPDSEDFVKLSQKTLRLNFGSLKKKKYPRLLFSNLPWDNLAYGRVRREACVIFEEDHLEK